MEMVPIKNILGKLIISSFPPRPVVCPWCQGALTEQGGEQMPGFLMVGASWPVFDVEAFATPWHAESRPLHSLFSGGGAPRSPPLEACLQSIRLVQGDVSVRLASSRTDGGRQFHILVALIACMDPGKGHTDVQLPCDPCCLVPMASM
jgi:hypothetical protein